MPTDLDKAEDEAFALLREVVTRARNGVSHREQLVQLREVLERVPEFREEVESALRRTVRASPR